MNTDYDIWHKSESIKYDWERNMGELPVAVVTVNN